MTKPCHLLNDLIEVARDGEQLYRDAMNKARISALKDWFRELGEIRRLLIDELSAHVRLLGATPSGQRTLLGASSQLYADFLTALHADQQTVYIDQLEEAEDRLLARYVKALRETTSDVIREVLERHIVAVQGAHERMRVLKREIHAKGAYLAPDSIDLPPAPGEAPRIEDVMVREVELIDAGASVQKAARLMAEQGVGFLPVCEQDRLIGVITDRDLVERVLADGRASDTTPVSDAMTPDTRYCYLDEDSQRVASNMDALHIRRLPVVDRSNHLVGVVSVDDIRAH